MSQPISSLERFHEAQDDAGIYERALAELRSGAKRSHWMWFVFPQLTGLGQSETSRRYGIESLAEARDYLADPILGERLRACASALLDSEESNAAAILGEVDAIKLRSSMTLFARADPAEPLFGEVLDRFYAAEPDPRTEALLIRFRP
jgi:uncharacterized protein (DUF1810 family)